MSGKRNNRYRVCIITDNPLRDLNGNTLLSYCLAKLRCDVFMVPMYEQELHLRSIKPHLVILNYARKGNAERIQTYHRAGIKIAVLDTEGGVISDVYRDLVGLVEKSDALSYVHYYFLWGREQQKAFQKITLPSSLEFFLTGTPRYDFVHKPWDAMVTKPNIDKGNYILFLTGFAVNNPEFSCLEREWEILRRDTLNTEEQIRERMEGLNAALKGVIALVKNVAQKYPEMTFVLRPHPFESCKVYEEAFSSLSNVVIRKEGNVSNWIKYAKSIVQLNSSTGIEAGFYGKKSILLALFQHPELKVPTVSDASYNVQTEKEFDDLMEWLIEEKHDDLFAKAFESIRENLSKIIFDWYYQIDGHAAERVAQNIKMVLDRDVSQGKVFFNTTVKQFFFFYGRYFVKKLYLMSNKKKAKKNKIKEISLNQVSHLLQLITTPSDSIEVRSRKVFWRPFSTESIMVRMSD